MAATVNTSRRRILVAGSVVVAALVVGALLSGAARNAASDDPRPAEADTETPGSPDPGDGSSAGSENVPVGFSHDEAGAAEAAIAYSAASQGWLYLTDEEIRAAVVEVATPTAAPRLADDVVADVSAARERLGASPGRVWWLVRPLAWEVESYADDEARVSVWTVTVLSAAEVAAPQTEWMTVAIDLAWVDGDWHVDAVRSAPGPTPMTGPNDRPWDAEPFDHALSGFTRIDEELVS